MLENCQLFSHLTPNQLKAVEEISILRSYESGEIIFYEGDESRYFHLLLRGDVSIFKSASPTETMRIHQFHAPSLIAEVATLKQIPFPASAECDSPSDILKIDREGFLELLREDMGLSISLIASLTQKIGALELSLKRHSAPNAMAKVARLVRDEPNIFTSHKQIEIAQMLSITPETLSRMLHKLKKENIIETIGGKSITLKNFNALEKYCE